MSSLVKGLEMPECCTVCPGFLISSGEPAEFICGFMFDELDGTTVGKPDWCPLVEVPPHGRLIDADALKSPHTDLAGNHFVYLVDIQEAPTIIEREGE